MCRHTWNQAAVGASVGVLVRSRGAPVVPHVSATVKGDCFCHPSADTVSLLLLLLFVPGFCVLLQVGCV